MTDVDVVLYGATGYTGRLVAHELDRLGARFLVAGRDATRLSALSASLASKPEAVAVPIDDAPGLRALASRGKALLSIAGPYARTGPPLVEAAIAARVPFGDVSGEQSYLRWCFEQEARVQAARIPVVNALGFDVVPSDFAAAKAATRLGKPVERLDIGVAISHVRTTRGTRVSGAITGGRGWHYADGRFEAAAVGRFARSFEFPPPLGRRSSVFIPWGDVVTAPRSTGAKYVRTFFTAKPGTVRRVRWTWPLLDLVTRIPWFARRMERKALAAEEGPTPEERAKARCTILAEAVAADGTTATAAVATRDPYELTARTASLAALRLSRGHVKKTGVLTPSQAFDVDEFAKELSAAGFSFL
ncbi:MAG: saccharopine dehydrogenase family protein [Methanobacteriota archaeon]